MRRHHDVAGRCPRPSMTSTSGGQPPSSASIQNAGHTPIADRYLGADFEVAVLLRKPALGRQDARDIFIVEQHGLQRRRACGWLMIERTPSLTLNGSRPSGVVARPP